MTDSNKINLEYATILVNAARIKALSDKCHSLVKISNEINSQLEETRAEMRELNREQPEDFKTDLPSLLKFFDL
tara:strand:- start:197 stop:418 length:222 start_codon:yes stop_codon:yes gene_type:complete